MSDEGMAKAGTVLLLVGAILSAAGAVLMLLLAIGLGTVISAIDGSPEGAAVIGIVYGAFALILAVGAIFGFLGYSAARAGDYQKAFVFGLICSLVPPIQVVPLLGAVFCKIYADK